MIRTVIWLFSGVLLGALIHLVVILTLPTLTETHIWDRLAALDADRRIAVLDAVEPGAPNPMRLDPELVYGVCTLDLSQGSGGLSGTLPLSFWSLAVYRSDGSVLYSTTNRESTPGLIRLGVFNAAQTVQLAQQDAEIEDGLDIVESDTDQIAIVVRLAPPHPAMQARYRMIMSELDCR
jgi:uncharacterized membrane protein